MDFINRFKQFIPGMGAEVKAEKRGTSHFDQVPEEYRSAVQSLAREGHEDFKELFPKFEDFLEAMSQMWLEKKSGFEDEAERLDFKRIISGMEDKTKNTKPSLLHRSVLALLTRNGSYVLVGPGAFDKDGPGAQSSYERINIRGGYGLPPVSEEKEDGFYFPRIPKLGQSLYAKGGVVTQTSPIISAMMHEMKEGESVAEIMGRTRAEVNRRFLEVQEQANLLPVSKRNNPPKK